MAIEMKKAKVKMNKSIYLGMSILDISKTLMYEFWYDYIKPKYQDRAKLCYMGTDSFIIHIKTEDFYKEIANDIEKWFETSNSGKDDNRPFSTDKNKKKIGFFKDESGGKVMKEFVGLRTKAYSYLMDDDSEHKKAKGTKKCIIKRQFMFKNYADCLFNYKIILKSQQRLKINCHSVYTEQINKIALSSNDDKYLTGKDILPSNQQEIIEEAKFTYSPFGKTFEKQIKAIEDQGEKQGEAFKDFKDHQKQLTNDYEDKLSILKEREMFKNIYNKRFDKIKELSEKIDDNNLVFTTISTWNKTDFIKKDDPLTFLNKIKKVKITVEEAKESQKDFINYLKMI